MVRRGWLNRAHSGIRARDVVIAVALLLFLTGIGSGLGGPARANANSVFAVDTAADSEDGSCGIAPQPCSLRDAIEAADAQPGPDSIAFDATVTTPIEPATPLPDITDPVAIDGSMAGVVVIDGSDVAGMGVDGLHVTADGSGSTI